jgi:hypothetical protein
MYTKRYVSSHFWDDSYIVELDPTEKLLFLYCITNPLARISGFYEISLRRIAFDTGIDKDMISIILGRFEKDKKVFFYNGFIIIPNFPRHQSYNSNMEKSISKDIEEAPNVLKASEGFQRLSKAFKHFEKDEDEVEDEVEGEAKDEDEGKKNVIDQKIKSTVNDYYKYISGKYGKLVPKMTGESEADSMAEIDKLIRLDGFDLKKIQEALTWGTQNEFWCNKILSLKGIRRKSKNGLSKFQNLAAAYESGKQTTGDRIMDHNLKALEAFVNG